MEKMTSFMSEADQERAYQLLAKEKEKEKKAAAENDDYCVGKSTAS